MALFLIRPGELELSLWFTLEQSLPRVSVDVINHHGLREDGRLIGIPGPVPTHRQVKSDKERVVKYPFRGTGVGRRPSFV